MDLVSFDMPGELLFFISILCCVCLLACQYFIIQNRHNSRFYIPRGVTLQTATFFLFPYNLRTLGGGQKTPSQPAVLFVCFLKMFYHSCYFHLYAIGSISSIMSISGEFELIQKILSKDNVESIYYFFLFFSQDEIS